MSKIISSIVALILGAALISVAFASTGDKGYYYGAKSPEHLAQLAEKSLAKDPSGGTLLDTKKCHDDGSCGSVLSYFGAFNEALEKAGFKKRLKSVSEVPAYIRSLKVIERPYGKYEVSCIRPLGNDKYKVIMDCLEREFESGEDAWVDSETQGDFKIDLMIITSKCANVVYRRVALKLTVTGHKCDERGYELTANAWLRSQFPTELGQRVDTLIADANARESHDATHLGAYQTDAISRTLGKRLREEVKVRAPITADIEIRYTTVDSDGKVMVDSQTKRPVVHHVGVLHMKNGVGTFKFPDDPRSRIVGTVWPEMFISPAKSGDERRLRIFPKEWGEACAVHMHGIIP